MPKDTEKNQRDVLHLQDHGFIWQWFDDNILNHIIDETWAYTLRKTLEEFYARKEGSNKMFLIKKLMRLRYKKGTANADHVNEF
jgi:hypothetical protein